MTIDQIIGAGIDLGSNTFRLLVAARTAEKLEILAKKLVTVRLGFRVAENQFLQTDKAEKGLEVLRDFRKILDHYQPQSIRVCGTEALRQAENSSLFLQEAEKILRNRIDIITGEEEARLSLAGALNSWENSLSGKILLVDAGGGSTEFVLADLSSGQTRAESTDMGVVSLTEKFPEYSPSALAALDKELAGKIGKCLKKLNISKSLSGLNIIGCGGSATSMAALALDLISYSESQVHGHILNTAAMEKLWNRLIALPPAKRNELPCLEEGRGEILPAGIRIYQVLLKLMQQEEMSVSDSGVLEGILLSSFQDFSIANSADPPFSPEN